MYSRTMLAFQKAYLRNSTGLAALATGGSSVNCSRGSTVTANVGCSSMVQGGSFLTSRRCLSTELVLDEETEWRHRMEAKYGTGNYQLFRPLYKDLCDEVRREYYTKPPPPFVSSGGSGTSVGLSLSDNRGSVEGEATTHVGGHRINGADGTAVDGSTAEDGRNAASAMEGEEDSDQQQQLSAPVSPPTFGDGAWSVKYQPENNFVVFRRDAVEASRMGRVVAYARVVVEDPPKLNALLSCADWCAIEVLVERKGTIIHFSIASNESGMHMRNARVYDSAIDAALMETTGDAEWIRHNLFYDGPCLWHLELDMQNELYDIMQDHGVNLEFTRWVAEWVFYLEHIAYTRWSLALLEELIPRVHRGPEEDFLLEREKAVLEEGVEDWLPAHSK